MMQSLPLLCVNAETELPVLASRLLSSPLHLSALGVHDISNFSPSNVALHLELLGEDHGISISTYISIFIVRNNQLCYDT